MSGGALRPWEKVYWGVFVAGLAVLLFNRLREAPKAPPDPAIAAAKEAAKVDRARLVLAGASVTEGEEDPFEGLAPEVGLLGGIGRAVSVFRGRVSVVSGGWCVR